MSENRAAMAQRMMQAQANAEVLKQFVPQLFTGPSVMNPQGEPDEKGIFDEWKLTNMPAECMVPLAGLAMISRADGDEDLGAFVEIMLRGFKGINGFAAKQAENIATSLAGRSQGKTVKRRGWVSRNVTKRGEPEFEEVGGEPET